MASGSSGNFRDEATSDEYSDNHRPHY